MRKRLGIAVLMLAICRPALAGEIPNPPAPAPQGLTASEPTAGDEPPEEGETDVSDLSDSFAGTLYDLLAVLPTLL